jgi:hypothetical protein
MNCVIKTGTYFFRQLLRRELLKGSGFLYWMDVQEIDSDSPIISCPPPGCIGRLFADPVDVERRSGYGLVSRIDPQLRERDFGREQSLPVAFASVANCKMVWRSPIGLTHTLILQLPRMRRSVCRSGVWSSFSGEAGDLGKFRL